MRETGLSGKLLKKLRELPFSFFTKIQQNSIRGTPDIVGCVGGHAVWLEAKNMTYQPDKLQEEILEQLIEAGAYARIVRLPKEAPEVLQDLHRMNFVCPVCRKRRG